MLDGSVIGTNVDELAVGTGVVFERFLLLFRSFFSPFQFDESFEQVDGDLRSFVFTSDSFDVVVSEGLSRILLAE